MRSALIKALVGKEARQNAGKFAGNVGRFLKPENMGAGELTLALLPDAAFGLMAAGMLPEEASFIDRGSMFLGSAAGGGFGGLATGSLVRKIPGIGKIPGAGLTGDMLGSIGGDMLGHQAALGVSALAGGGKNIYERMEGAAADEYRKQIEQETLAALGFLPGVRHDDFMRSQGLA